MEGNKNLINILNSLLADELTAINQNMAHSEMCENWGYAKLYLAIHGHVMDEIQHTEWLIERINFIEGAPTVSRINPIKIGNSVTEIIYKNLESKLKAVNSYKNAIQLANELYDQGTVDLLTKVVKTEEEHVDWNQIQRSQIDQMGMENYLISQT